MSFFTSFSNTFGLGTMIVSDSEAPPSPVGFVTGKSVLTSGGISTVAVDPVSKTVAYLYTDTIPYNYNDDVIFTSDWSNGAVRQSYQMQLSSNIDASQYIGGGDIHFSSSGNLFYLSRVGTATTLRCSLLKITGSNVSSGATGNVASWTIGRGSTTGKTSPPTKIVTDSSDNSYYGFYDTTNVANNKSHLIKTTSAGALSWQIAMYQTSTFSRLRDIAIQSNGANVATCGYFGTRGSVFKFSSTNAYVWGKELYGASTGDYIIFPELNAVCFDPSNNIVVAGTAAGNTAKSYLGQIVSLAASNGAILWNLQYDRVYSFYSIYCHTDGYIYAGGMMKTYPSDPVTNVVGGIILKINPGNGQAVNHITFEVTGGVSVVVDKISLGTKTDELCVHMATNPTLDNQGKRVVFIPTDFVVAPETYSGIAISSGKYTITTSTSRFTNQTTTTLVNALTPASTVTTQVPIVNRLNFIYGSESGTSSNIY